MDIVIYSFSDITIDIYVYEQLLIKIEINELKMNNILN